MVDEPAVAKVSMPDLFEMPVGCPDEPEPSSAASLSAWLFA